MLEDVMADNATEFKILTGGLKEYVEELVKFYRLIEPKEEGKPIPPVKSAYTDRVDKEILDYIETMFENSEKGELGFTCTPPQDRSLNGWLKHIDDYLSDDAGFSSKVERVEKDKKEDSYN